ncbi:predicted protein [Histoplasma capsulatum G186AR]|uniref:Ubiquitin-conjugating enzyme E2C-binding protein n=1 Tax=Ajellomyces capsulatus (strain G186AR / H82 / ATCC MYA-2454 / RMSCC 2432) TaxID=447093 RepID=C0NUQ4_AJECG|nr:uncharacterized protein HCBG_06668 [Histoplasma capsulatum G186AR]EEH04717.1 predicted protein [Histoplasma capsulatum G186AR]
MPSRTESGPLLYAELLPNIRQITLHVSLPASSRLAQSSITSDTPGDLVRGNFSLSLLPSRDAVSLYSSHTVHTLPLPACVSESAHTILSTKLTPNPPGAGHGELLFRLPVDVEAGLPGASQPANGQPGHGSNEVQVPWTAKDMCAESRVRCQRCKNTLFTPSDKGKVTWKDLPSTDWAEMMDLWHCHKPDTHADDHGDAAVGTVLHTHDENETVKGYGASNQVVCTSGTVLIDVLSFVMAEGDCQGLQKSKIAGNPRKGFRASDYLVLSPTAAQSIMMKEARKWENRGPNQMSGSSIRSEILPLSSTSRHIGNGNQPANETKFQPVVDLSCSRCSAVVGEEHKAFSGLRLYKANVSLLRKPKDGINSDHDVWETYPVDMIVGTQLLDLVERVGARRFAVHSAEYTDTSSRDNKIGLLLWVFNPDLRYSSLLLDSTTDKVASITSQRAMKILYQEVQDVQSMLNPAQGVPSPAALEEVSLPPNIYDGVKQTLERTSEALPISARLVLRPGPILSPYSSALNSNIECPDVEDSDAGIPFVGPNDSSTNYAYCMGLSGNDPLMTSVAGYHAQNDRGYEADNDLPAPTLAPGHTPVPTSSLMQINATIPIAVGGTSSLAFDSRIGFKLGPQNDTAVSGS